MTPTSLVSDVSAWLDAHRRAGPGSPYAFSTTMAQPDLYGLIDAVVIRYTLGCWPPSAEEREGWVRFIRRFQDRNTGYFNEDVTWHQPIHATAHAAWALRSLDQRPLHPFSFADAWRDRRWMGTTLEKSNWAMMRKESHIQAGVASAFLATGSVDDEWWNLYFSTIDRHVDARTGLVAGPEPSIEHLRGTFHYALLYAHQGRRWPYPHALLESVEEILANGWPGEPLSPGGADLVAAFVLNFLLTQDPSLQGKVRRLTGQFLVGRLGSVLGPAGLEARADNLHRGALLICAIAIAQRLAPELLGVQHPLHNYLEKHPWI